MDFSALAGDLGRDPGESPPEPPKSRSGGMSWLWALVAAIAAGAWCYYVIVNPTGTGGRTMAGNIKELDKAGFEAAIASGVTLVDFWAPWCGPCRAQAPILEEVQKALEGKASIAKLNVDDNGELAAQFDVASIPTLIIFKDGAEVNRYTGVRQKDELVAGITQHLGS